MKYTNYLKNKNLSKHTITAYVRETNKWTNYLEDKKPNKTMFVKYIKSLNKNYSPNSIHLSYSAILSFLKFQKKWKLINEFKDIKLPTIQRLNKTTITLDEFKNSYSIWDLSNWYKKRNYLIFKFLFLTGLRISELFKFKKNELVNNTIKISGKGNKTRIIYLPDELIEDLNQWKGNNILIKKNKTRLTYKQVNLIIKKIGKEIFNKYITPHSLRRSYATNLLRNKVDLKTVSVLLGHSNINTTSQYIHLNCDEIIDIISKIL